jgi:conjugative relaxase-like TrwC/TraI family protein
MLARPANITAQQASHYYEQDDYYDRASDANAKTQFAAYWFGKGAQALGVEGAIESGDFKSLLEGRSPGGRRLHAKPIQAEIHRAGTDYTFNAPKSVSIAALVQQDEQLVSAHDQAVRMALEVLEERYAQARVWDGRQRRQVRVGTGNLAIGVYRHETSRNQDPHLHSHCVAINATQVEGGQWRAVSNELAVRHQKLLGQIYQNELAVQGRRLGYEIERRDQGQFDLRGYDEGLLRRFSSRRQEMETFVAESGEPETSRLLQRAALQTRQRKTVLPREQVAKLWQQDGEVLPQLPEAIKSGWQDEARAEGWVARAVEELEQQRAVFSREELERHLLEHHLGHCSFQQLQRAIKSCPRLCGFDGELTMLDQVAGLRSLEALLGEPSYAKNQVGAAESVGGAFAAGDGAGVAGADPDALRASRGLGAVTDRLYDCVAVFDGADWAAEFAVGAVAQGVRARGNRERNRGLTGDLAAGLESVAAGLHCVGELCGDVEQVARLRRSKPGEGQIAKGLTVPGEDRVLNSQDKPKEISVSRPRRAKGRKQDQLEL